MDRIEEIRKDLEGYSAVVSDDWTGQLYTSARFLLAEVERLEKESQSYQDAMSQWITTTKGYQDREKALVEQRDALMEEQVLLRKIADEASDILDAIAPDFEGLAKAHSAWLTALKERDKI